MRSLVLAGMLLSAAPYHVVAQHPAAGRPQLFAFHSAFWVNLHHFLYATARARLGLDVGRSATVTALADTAGFGALPAADRAAWEGAVTFYDSSLARRDALFDHGMVAINNALASAESSPGLASVAVDRSLRTALERAAPVYRRLWWPRHDAANRQWIDRMTALLARHGDSMAKAEARLFRQPWSTGIRADASAYANWAGAYTTNEPSHITIATIADANQDDQGLEILFHEVLHTMDDTLSAALVAAFRVGEKALPRDPTHPFIFFTAGVLTQRAMAAHVPYAEKNGLWVRAADFAHALPLLQRDWLPYLDGEITLEEAVARYAKEY